MDRERLIRKRKVLQKNLALTNALSRIDRLIQHLITNEVAYKIHMENEAVTAVLLTYPSNFSGLDWSLIPNSEKVAYHSINERTEIISTIITQYLGHSNAVFIVWSDGSKPILEMPAQFAADCSGILADEDFDMWILNLEKGFCLEHYHEGYVAWTHGCGGASMLNGEH